MNEQTCSVCGDRDLIEPASATSIADDYCAVAIVLSPSDIAIAAPPLPVRIAAQSHSLHLLHCIWTC
jgi:hypothetical protein